MDIALIGPGIMGKSMSLNLHKAGHTVFVHGRRAESMTLLCGAGCTACDTPAEAASKADIVILRVSDTPDAEQVIFGDTGVIHGARPGTVVIDMSTISPTITRRFAEDLRARGIEMQDAPVSGGDAEPDSAAVMKVVERLSGMERS